MEPKQKTGNIRLTQKSEFLNSCRKSIAALSVFLLVTALGLPQAPQEERWKELNAQAEDLYNQKKYAEAIPIAQEALRLAEESFGPEHHAVVTSLNQLAILYYFQRQDSDARPLFQRALEIGEKALGPEHPEVAKALHGLARLYYMERKYDEAEPLLLRSLVIFEKALGLEHLEVAKALYNLARLYVSQRKYDEAESLYIRSLTIFENIYGADNPEVAITLDGLAYLYSTQQKYTDAEQLYRRSLNIRKKAYGEDHPEVAYSLANLARLYEDQRKLEEAERFFRSSLTIREKAYGPDHPEVAQVLYDLAWLYRSQFKYTEAEKLFQRVLRIREKAYGEEHPRITSILNNLAGLYSDQRKYDEAERLYRRSLAIREKAYGTDHPRVASELSNLANLYLYQGKYDEAEPLLKRALQIREKAYGPEDEFLSTPLGNLAWAYIYQGNYDEAEPLLKRALQIREKAHGPDGEPVASPLYALARFHISQGKFDEAEPLLQRAISIYEKISKTSHPNVAVFLNYLSDIYIHQDKYSEAEPLLRRALDILIKVVRPEHPEVGIVLSNFARLYYARGQRDQAQAFFDRSLQNMAKQFEYHFTYMSEKERLLFLDKVSEAFPLYYSFCFAYRKQDPTLVGKMYDVLLWQKGFVVSSISTLRSQILASGDPEALKLLEKLTAIKTQLANLIIAQPIGRRPSRTLVQQLEKETNELEKELVRRSTTFAEQKRLAHITWRDVQKALKKKETAVELVRFRYHDGKRWTDKIYYAALIVTPESETAPTLVLLGEEEKLEGSPLSEYRKLVEARVKPRARSDSTIYSAFWKPLETALAKTKRIYLSPDGILNLISWGALPAGDGRLLMEKYDLRTLSSTKDILREKYSHEAKSTVLIGNPRFSLEEDQHRTVARTLQQTEQSKLLLAASERGRRSREQRGGNLPSLPGTKEELESIQSLLKKEGWETELYTEENALEEAIKSVQRPRVLHVATHGFFLPDQEVDQLDVRDVSEERPSGRENPMLRSGLFFAGADQTLLGGSTPPELDDGVLTAYEATGLNLHGTELVVLSACETGLGEVKNGEGVFGLRRALQVAGAEAVLMSLWPVPDQETKELMTLFYNKWLAGKDKYKAFREAQMELRAKVKERYGHDLPFYWAAFVLVGR